MKQQGIQFTIFFTYLGLEIRMKEHIQQLNEKLIHTVNKN